MGERHDGDGETGEVASPPRDPAANPLTGNAAVRIVALSAANGVLLWIAPEDGDALRLFFASAMLWACALPWYLHTRKRSGTIPLVPMMSLAFFVYYGFPVFTGSIHVFDQPYDRPVVTWAVGLALLAQLLLTAVTYVPLPPAVKIPRPRLEVDLGGMRWWLIVAAMVTMPLAIIGLHGRQIPEGLAGLLTQGGRLPMLFLLSFFLVHLRDGSTGMQRLVAFALLAIYVLNGLATGSLAHVVYAGMPLVFVYIRERKAVPWALVAVSAIALVPFLTTKLDYRAELRRDQDLDVIDRVELFFGITFSEMDSGGGNFWSRAMRTSQHRVSMLGTFAYVIEATPSRVPYWEGETYLLFPWSFVPRFIVPDKPNKSLGQDFGHRYMLLNPGDYGTSYNFPQLVEMYANFGTWGVIIGIMVIGLFFRLLESLFNHGREGTLLTPIAAMMFTDLMNIESDVSLVLGGVPQTMAVGLIALLGIAWISGSRLRSAGAGVSARPAAIPVPLARGPRHRPRP